MSENSKIEWTDATWNCLLGCSLKSEGCVNCYAITTAWRLMHNPNPKIAAAYAGIVKQLPGGKITWTGKINLVEDRLTDPLRWKRPRRIFVNSQSDVFHPDVPFDYVDKMFAVMALAPQHTFQILTKRPDRMREYWKMVDGKQTPTSRIYDAAKLIRKQFYGPRAPYNLWTNHIVCLPIPLPNVQLGTSVENQPAAENRVLQLLETPATVRFLSCEPLLGPVNLRTINVTPSITFSALGGNVLGPKSALDWVIVGGESGTNARPMHPEWARLLRDQCVAAGVPFFFKQWGAWKPIGQMTDGESDGYYDANRHGKPKRDRYERNTPKSKPVDAVTLQFDGSQKDDYPAGAMLCYRVGKHAAGRLLDGREWNEMPV